MEICVRKMFQICGNFGFDTVFLLDYVCENLMGTKLVLEMLLRYYMGCVVLDLMNVSLSCDQRFSRDVTNVEPIFPET